MMPPTSPNAEPVAPNPPRFRWLKRGVVFFFLLLASLAALRAWWGYEAQRRLNAMVAAAHARGEPILIEDFQPAPIPDAENAAVLLAQVVDAFKATAAEKAFEAKHTEVELPLSTVDLEQLSSILDHRREELRLARMARARSRTQWAHRISHPVYDVRSLRLGKDRALARLLGWAVLYEHTKGNDGEVIEDVRDILALGEATDHDAPNIVTHLVALGIDMLACEVAREIGAHLQVSAATPSHGTLPAQREQVLSLVRLLLDDSSYREGLRRAAFGERLIRIDAAPDIAKELWGDAAFALVPLSQLTVMRSCGEMTSMADAAEDLNWWTAVRKIAPYETTGWRSRLEVFSQEPALFIGFSSYRPLQMHFAQMGTRRMTAILLALRLYEIDHGGNLPESLAQLVPEYLPRVPADPFRSDNSALGYLPRRVPPAVYSVGYDGRDQGASEKLPAGQSKRASSTPWDFEDAVFPLRRALTSTDTQDNQGEVGESQRKKSQDQNE